MTRLVSIGRDDESGSPFRVIGPNAGPEPGLNDVIFDGNYETLVVLQKGYVNISSAYATYLNSVTIPLVKDFGTRKPMFSFFTSGLGTSLVPIPPSGGAGRAPQINAMPWNYIGDWQWIEFPGGSGFWAAVYYQFVQGDSLGFLTTPTYARAWTDAKSYQTLRDAGNWTVYIDHMLARTYYLIFNNTVG